MFNSGTRGQGRLSLGPYLEFIARVNSHIPDKGQVMVRYFGLCERPSGEGQE
ncbi:hypothetical protein D4S03_11790, partial [bacterium]